MTFKNEDFVHFHVHTEYSHLDCINKVKDLVATARKMGFRSLATTDHGSVMSFQRFIKECKSTLLDENGEPYPVLSPILGSELYLSKQMNIGQYPDDPVFGENGEKLKPADLQPDKRKGNTHLNVYAMNYDGYKSLCSLSEESWTRGFYSSPRIDIDTLQKYSKGIMIGSACLASIVNQNLLVGDYDKAKEYCGIFNEISGGNFFLEAMYHGIPEEKYIIPSIFKLSVELDIPVLLTGDVHYLHKSQAKSHEVLMAMSTSKCIKDPTRMSFSFDEFYLKSAQEMSKGFESVPQVLSNTVALSERIDFADIERNLYGGMRMPNFDIPDKYSNPYDYLCELAWTGLKRHNFDQSRPHIDALKKELADVKVAYDNNDYDFSTYFLIVRDYIMAAKQNNILVGPGRGSGYASVLLRCLDITYGEDPLAHGLLWERFLGFSSLQFITDKDFGFGIETTLIDTATDSDNDSDILSLEDERDLEDDQGGVDRY